MAVAQRMQLRGVLTTIIVGASEATWTGPTAKLLRERGMKVVRLPDLAIVGFLLISDQITAVLVDGRLVSSGWKTTEDRMRKLAPDCRIVVVHDPDQSPQELARLVLP